jgi:hypothetical protein
MSPEVYPRYLFMLLPLLFSSFFHLYIVHSESNTPLMKFVTMVFGVFLTLMVLGSMVPVFLERTQAIPFLHLKSGLLFAGSLGLAIAYWKIRELRLYVMIAALLWMRLGFNWFVLPDRLAEDWGTLCRETSKEAGQKFKESPLYLFGDTELQMTNAFYLTNARQQIIRSVTEKVPDSTALYIIDLQKYPDLEIQKFGEFKYRHGKGTLVIGKISD